MTSLGWAEARNVFVIDVGQDMQALTHQLAAANQHISQLEAQAQQLQSQLQQIQSQQQTPLDPKAAESLAALVELAKALRLVRLAAAQQRGRRINLFVNRS